MIDPLAALQTAVETVLRADAGVLAAFGSSTRRIYDRVPHGNVNVYPYITIGENDQAVDDADSCFDTVDAYIQVDVWSRGVGKAQVKAIGAAVVEALNTTITVTGFHVITHQVDRVRYGREADQLTERGTIVIRYGVIPDTGSP